MQASTAGSSLGCRRRDEKIRVTASKPAVFTAGLHLIRSAPVVHRRLRGQPTRSKRRARQKIVAQFFATRNQRQHAACHDSPSLASIGPKQGHGTSDSGNCRPAERHAVARRMAAARLIESQVQTATETRQPHPTCSNRTMPPPLAHYAAVAEALRTKLDFQMSSISQLSVRGSRLRGER